MEVVVIAVDEQQPAADGAGRRAREGPSRALASSLDGWILVENPSVAKACWKTCRGIGLWKSLSRKREFYSL